MIALLFAALLSPLAQAEDGGLPTRLEVESLLERRLSLKTIEDRCIPERRSTKGLVLLAGGAKIQVGQLYAGQSKVIDKVSWGTEFRGDELTFYVVAKKDGAFWLIDSGHEKELRRPLTTE
jgi:hypothetical protein